MSFGPNPWQQTNWDWRAAGNFIGGGAGSGLIMFTALAGVEGTAAAVLLLVGLALVGLGLACVWLELGRPLGSSASGAAHAGSVLQGVVTERFFAV